MEYLKLGITPISEENRVGEDVKYDEDFEKIESEISKLTSPSVSNGIDWNLVVKLSETILESKSKNLLVTVYLSYALYKTRGVDGLFDGVEVLADILENYWEDMYPPLRRIKGRVNAIEWMLEKISKDMENAEAVEVDSDKKDNFINNLKKIDDFLNEKMENAPLFYNLIKLADIKLQIKSQEMQEEQETPVIKTEKKEIKTIKEDKQDFTTILSSLNIEIGKMIEAKDYRSELFMINRASIWLSIDELPTHNKNITMLPPPDSVEVDILQKLYTEKDYNSLLWASESRISKYIFWLDLHFYVFKSLENLGYKKEAQDLLDQTLYFLKKLPNIENLSFSDTTPFADDKTKKWLDSKKADTTIKVSKVVEDKKEIKNDVDCNDVDGLCLLMRSAISVEEKVLYNIELCKCLAKTTNEIAIKTYTVKLLDTIKKYKVDRWKPEIALNAYLASFECLKNLDDEESAELQKELSIKMVLLKPSSI